MNLIYDQMVQEAAAARTEARKQRILAELWPDEQRDFLRPPAKGVHALLLILAALAVAGLLVVAMGAGLARADETHHRDVKWAMPEQGEQASWPQSLAGELVPGVCYQVDRYREDADLSFLDDGVLAGPSEDGHALDYEHPFPETGQPWRFVCVPDEPTPTPEPTPTEPPTSEEPTETPSPVEPTPEPSTEPPTEEPSTPAPTEPPTTVEPSPEPSSPEPEPSTPVDTPTPDIGTPTSDERTVEPTTDEPVVAQQERLAETGLTDTQGAVAGLAVLLVLSGAAVLYVRKIRAER